MENAVCELISAKSGHIGTIYFKQDGDKTTVTGKVSTLTPGLHGFHIHQFGDTTGGCATTGPHYNPNGCLHGAPSDEDRHAGDLGNILVDDSGTAEVNIVDMQIPVSSIVGRAVVVHDGEDDLGRGGHELSKTTGNAGGRYACGVIALAPTPSL